MISISLYEGQASVESIDGMRRYDVGLHGRCDPGHTKTTLYINNNQTLCDLGGQDLMTPAELRDPSILLIKLRAYQFRDICSLLITN